MDFFHVVRRIVFETRLETPKHAHSRQKREVEACTCDDETSCTVTEMRTRRDCCSQLNLDAFETHLTDRYCSVQVKSMPSITEMNMCIVTSHIDLRGVVSSWGFRWRV
jgi:hypothetical protein